MASAQPQRSRHNSYAYPSCLLLSKVVIQEPSRVSEPGFLVHLRSDIFYPLQVAELQEVKEYVQFLSQASVPSNHFQTRPVSPQPSDWLHLEPSEPSNVANSTDSRTMAGEAWESKVPDAATDGSNFPAAGHAEANGKTSPELKAKREEKPSGSKRTGLREESEESLSKNEGPESNSGYASVESGTASNLVEGGETERLSTPTETERLSTPTEPERRWGTEDQMRVKHVAAEERQWATGTEQNEDSVSPEEPLSLKKESSLKKVGFAPEAAGEVSATEWRKAERLQMEVLGIGQSSKYSASQKGGEVYQAVRSVREEDKIVFEDLVKVGQNRVEIAGNRVEKGSVKAAQKTEKGVDEGIQEVRGVAKKMEKAVESRLEETGRKADGSDGSGMSGSNVERSAVGAVEEGMGDRRWGAEKAVEKGKVTASGVVRTAETIVAKRVEEVVEAGRSLEQSTGQTRVEIAEIAWKADSSARQGGEIEVEEAIGAARILERKAERRTAEGVPDARDPRLRTDPEAKDARGAVKALEPSAFDALSEKSSREERSTVWDEDVGVEEVAKSDENRAQDTAVDSRITEATERDAARECAVPDGERSRTRAQTPVSRGHALGSGMTSNLGNDGTDGRPTEGTGSSDVPRIPIAKPASDGLRSEPSSTGLGSETAPSDALRSGRETSSVRSSAETLHSPLDSTHPGGGVEFSEARQERLQENLAPSEVTTEIQNWGLTERPRVSSSLPVHDSLPAVGNPVSRASETSGSTERSPADTLRTDQRTEGGAKTREPTSKTESGAGTDEASTESEPQYGEHLEEILDELDLDLDGLEVAGEASARSAAAAAADGEGFEVHHEESHAQLFVPDESDIVEEAW